MKNIQKIIVITDMSVEITTIVEARGGSPFS